MVRGLCPSALSLISDLSAVCSDFSCCVRFPLFQHVIPQLGEKTIAKLRNKDTFNVQTWGDLFGQVTLKTHTQIDSREGTDHTDDRGTHTTTTQHDENKASDDRVAVISLDLAP